MSSSSTIAKDSWTAAAVVEGEERSSSSSRGVVEW